MMPELKGWNRDAIQFALKNILKYIGEDPDREGLKDTPRRIVDAWDEMLSGYSKSPKNILDAKFQADGYDEMVTVRGIEFTSFCEHHWLPFSGHVDFGYIPTNGTIVGLSKIPRLVDCFAKRLQVQERMTSQIAEAFASLMPCDDVGVVVTAVHSCMSCRGVRKQDADMVTSKLIGGFKDDPDTRGEFLSFCSRRK